MRFVDLSEEEKLKLEDLYKNSDSHVTRDRCLCLLLSSKRHSMKDISGITGINWLKIVRLFNHWQQADDKYSILSIASGRGAKVKLSSVKAILPEPVDKHPRNLTPILEERQHNISVCKLTLQKTLGYSWKRARLSLKSVRNQELFEAKRKQLNSLMNLHNQGYTYILQMNLILVSLLMFLMPGNIKRSRFYFLPRNQID